MIIRVFRKWNREPEEFTQIAKVLVEEDMFVLKDADDVSRHFLMKSGVDSIDVEPEDQPTESAVEGILDVGKVKSDLADAVARLDEYGFSRGAILDLVADALDRLI